MTQTAIIGLAIALLLIAGSMFGIIPGFITAITLIIEAVLIFGGSRLSK